MLSFDDQSVALVKPNRRTCAALAGKRKFAAVTMDDDNAQQAVIPNGRGGRDPNGCSYCSALRYAGGSNSLSGLDSIAGLTVTMGPVMEDVGAATIAHVAPVTL